MINFKYLAGFTDSDGSIDIYANKRVDGTFCISPRVRWGQKDTHDKVLHHIADFYKVPVTAASTEGHSNVSLNANAAVRCLEAIRAHSVVKKNQIDYVLSLPRYVDREQLKTIRKGMKQVRATVCDHGKPRPSTAWAAGYIDGDGCFSAYVNKHGAAMATLIVSSWVKSFEGLELLQKAHGGKLYHRNVSTWKLGLAGPAAQVFLQKIVKHSIVKKSQILHIVHFYRSDLQRRGASSTEYRQQWARELKALKRTRID